MKPKLKNIRTAELLVLIASDNKDAFGEFFTRHHAKMLDFAMLFVKSGNDAEEVVSRVIEKLLKQRKKISQINNMESYLFLSIKNTAINYNKSFSKKSFVTLLDPDQYKHVSYLQPYESLVESELRHKITQCVENLPLQRRMVYKLVKDEDHTLEQVAELLDISEKTVKNHLALAVRDLKHSIETYLGETRQLPLFRIAKFVSLLILSFCV